MNFFDNNVFDDITFSGDIKLVKNVSHLRHFINCFGVNEVKSYFNFDDVLIDYITTYCFGDDLISQINEDLIKERIEIRENRDLRIRKNAELINILQEKRNSFCGIGTNKIKRRLNKLSKTDYVAKAIRLLLEIEDKNIQAKNSYSKYKDKIYNKKYELIHELIDMCVRYQKHMQLCTNLNFRFVAT